MVAPDNLKLTNMVMMMMMMMMRCFANVFKTYF